MGIATAERRARVGDGGCGRRSWLGRSRSPAVIAESFDRGLRARANREGTELSLVGLCEVCAQATQLLVSIVLSGPGATVAAVGTSAGAGAIEELQLTLGEGPGIDVWGSGRPVLVDDLSQSGSRWANFAPEAWALGVRAAYSYPLRVGVIRVGVLGLYAERVSPLTTDASKEFAALAELVTDTLLGMQSGASRGSWRPRCCGHRGPRPWSIRPPGWCRCSWGARSGMPSPPAGQGVRRRRRRG